MRSSQNYLIPGVPFALGSAVLFGATPPLSKLLLHTIHPLMLAGFLYLGAGIGLAIYRLLRGPSEGEAQLSRADIPWLVLAIGLGGVIAPLLLMAGLMRSPAASASLLLNLEGLATMAIAWVVYRENVDRRLLIGAGAILLGAVLLSWGGQGVSLSLGALFVTSACVAWGLDNNFTRKISATDPLVIAMLKGLVAGTINIGLAVFAGESWPPFSSIAAASAVGLFGIGISLVMFILALRHLGTARTGAYYSLAPFIGALLAIIILREPVTITLLLAGLLMGIGLWLHLSERHEHEHDHEELAHEHRHMHDEHHQHRHEGPVTEPHSHWHHHARMRHKHPHYPDLHHRHSHG
ncbi:DMT family transporter [soil metagenome]